MLLFAWFFDDSAIHMRRSSMVTSLRFGLETYSPYQDKDLTDYRIFDSGDLELCFGNTEDALSDIEQHADQPFPSSTASPNP